MSDKGKDQPQQFSDTAGINKPNTIQGINANTWFGPLEPLPNFAPQNVTGRAWDFPVGYNIMYQPRPLSNISFDVLRRTANNCDIMSIIINHRKDQVESKRWIIKGTEGIDLEDNDPRVKEMTDFWKRPDKTNTFDQWLKMWMDDLFVIDAPALYVRRNRIGGIYGIENIDGAKIKLLVDAQGRTPAPPNPAYQMILKSVPAIAYTTDELIYSPRNKRTYDPYGRSPVEMTVVTINAAINRAIFNRDYYTEGNIPDAVGSLSENFTPQQAAQFTEWWDTLYSGNLAQRHKVKFVPGMDHFFQLKEPEQKNVYDDYIARILCFAMGISPQPFISQVNRATAETQEESSEKSGQQPIENSICAVINRIIQGEQFFNYPDLEFSFDTAEDPDPKLQSEILIGHVKEGIITRDAAREKLGEEPEGGIAAELCITTASGIMTLDDADAQAKQNLSNSQEAHDQLMDGGSELMGNSPSVDRTPRSPKPTDKKAEKSKGSKKNFRKIHIASLSRRKIVRAKKAVAAIAIKNLIEAKREVIRDLHLQTARFVKADTPEQISLTVELTGLDDLSTEIEPILREIADDAGRVALASLGVGGDDITNQVFQRAVDYAESRAAELVTEITDSTRDRLRQIIADGLEDNLGRDAIIDLIEQDQSGLFDKYRAELIADYEIGSANGVGALEGLEQAQEAGVELLKEWYPDAEACPICQGNADVGPIPIDEQFPSGDDAPLAHPNCECSLLGVVSE